MNIVITGASSGIGRDIALKLAEEQGNKIYAISRNKSALRSLAGECANKNIIPVVLDITGARSSLRELKNSIAAEAGSIDIIINNAGFLINKPFTEHSDEDIASIVAVNFTAPAAIVSELLPLMSRGSHVVNIGSMGGFQGSMKFSGSLLLQCSKGGAGSADRVSCGGIR